MSKVICDVKQDFFKGGKAYKKGEKTEDFDSEQARGYSDYLAMVGQVQEQVSSGSFQDNIHNTNIHNSNKKGGKKR